MSINSESTPSFGVNRRGTSRARLFVTVAASALLAGGGVIWANGISDTGSGNQSVTTGLDYTTISGNAGGVDVRSTGGFWGTTPGSATVDVGIVTAAFGNQFGIRAYSINGDVGITADAVSSQGMGVEALVRLNGVLGGNGSGNITIDIGGGAGAVTSANSAGIQAETGNGIISILAGDVTAGTRGIDASNRAGDISVTAGDVISGGTGVSASVDGILGIGANGNISITTGAVTSSTGGGISASTGAGTITIGAGDVASGNTGVKAEVRGLGTGDVDVAVGNVTSANGDGIDARTYFGTIGIAAGDVTANNGAGVKASTAFNVDLSDITGGLSDPLGLLGDALTGDAIGVDVGTVSSHGTGISAVVSGGNIPLVGTVPGLGGVSVAAGDVTSTDGSGIIASTGIGGVHVTAGDVSAGGGTGVSATSGFAVNIPDLAGLLGGSGGTPNLTTLGGLLDAGVSVDVGNVDASGAGIVAEVAGINVPLIGDLPGIGNVSVKAGDVGAGGDGITAGTGIGYAMVDAENVDAGGDGIAASAGIGLASVTAGNVSAGGQGVSATVTGGNLGALGDLVDLLGGVPGLEGIIGDLDGAGIAFAMVGDVTAGAGGVNASAGMGGAIAIAGDVTSGGPGVRAAVGDGSGNGTGLALAMAGNVTTSGAGAVGIDASAQGIAAALGSSVTTTGAGATGVRVVAQGGALGGLIGGLDGILGGLGLGDLGDMADDLAGGLGLPPGLASGALDLVPDLLTLVDGTAVAAVGSVSTSGDDATGIYAEGTTAVVVAGSVTTTGAGSTGIRNNADGTSITIFGSVSTSGNNAPAVHATDPSSDVWVIGGLATTTGDSSDGIHAWSGTDDVNVYVVGVTTGGDDSEGIHAAANAGDIDIYAGAVTTAGADSTGIHAWSGAGDIDIYAGGVITGDDDSDGIRAVASDGSISVDAVAVATTGNYSEGIHAEATGGDIDIDAGVIGTAGDESAGIYTVARDGGNISVDAVAVATGGEDSHGIYADAFGGGDIELNAGVVGTTRDYSTGISAWADNEGNGGGNIGISADSITTEGYEAFGVWAHSEGSGGGGDITVDVGSIATTGGWADGIVAMTDDGGDIRVDADTVSTEGDSSKGIYASAWSDGNVTVTAETVTTAGADATGIHAEAEDGNVTVDAGSVNASGAGARGIYAMSDSGKTEVTVHVEAIGGTGTGAAGVEFGGATGAVLNNHGFITAFHQPAILNDDRNSGVNNDGTVLGFVEMGGGADTFNNNAAGTFIAHGDSDFGDGGDLFVNDGLVTMRPWRVGTETVTVKGLETFNNLDDGLIDLANGAAGDILDLVISNVDSTGTFAIDANLTPDGSPADQLHVGSDLTGTTALSVNDLDSGPGAYDPNGHLFAVVKGSTDAGNVPGVPSNFSVNGGAGIDKGLFRYDAYLLPAAGNNKWYLASVLDREAYEFPVIAGAMQSLWHASTGVWLDRTSDLRLGYGEAQTPVKAGAWLRLFGGNERRDFSNAATAPGGMIGPDHTYDGRFHQDYRGIMVGFDYIVGGQAANGADNAWLFGVLVGRTTADLDFDNSTTRVDSRANSVGAYATYMQGGLFVDTLLKADFGKLDYASTLGGSTTETASGDFRSVGLSVDAGYRYDAGANWFIEPKATLAYVRTRYDNLDVAGTDVAFDNGESLRGRIGARVGTRIVTESGAVVEPWLEASLWHEFRGDYRVTLLSGGPDAAAGYDMGGTFGQISGGVSFLNTGTGWTGFAKGSVYLGDDKLRGASANLGLRYTW